MMRLYQVVGKLIPQFINISIISNGGTLNYNYNIDSKHHEHFAMKGVEELQLIRILTQKEDLIKICMQLN